MNATDKVLNLLVGITAVTAPALHMVTDIMEWINGGFTETQLWINYIAFLPMSWLLFGLYVIRKPLPGAAGLIGSILYGAAFTYFAFTTLYALNLHLPDYETLWKQLSAVYTFHGILMISGGLMFGLSMWKAKCYPGISLILFLSGISVNLIIGIIPAPDIFQTIGSTLRNTGIILMGYSALKNIGN